MKRVFLLVLMLLLMVGCNGTGYRVTLAVRNAADTTSKSLAVACGQKRVDCKEKHQIKTPGYAMCMKHCVKALDAWAKIVKPAVNTSLRAAWVALEAKKDWKKALKPGACALIKAVTVDWKALLGKHMADIAKYLKIAEGLVCK